MMDGGFITVIILRMSAWSAIVVSRKYTCYSYRVLTCRLGCCSCHERSSSSSSTWPRMQVFKILENVYDTKHNFWQGENSMLVYFDKNYKNSVRYTPVEI